MTEELIEFLEGLLQETANTFSPGISILIVLAIAAGSYLLVRYLLLGIILRKFDTKKHKWLNTAIKAGIPQLLTLLVPPLVIWTILPYYSLETDNPTVSILSRLLAAYVALVITLILNGGLLAINHYYNTLESSRTFPISSILDVVRVILFVLSAVVIISILFSVQAIYILTVIGALIAAGTVVFNNLILAFVSGLIVTSKKLIVIGDWIEIPELHINGEVREITLTTVIVRNLDHTIGTVPSSYLLTNSYKNWRGIQEAGARQISWQIDFDLNSVKPASPELLEEISSLSQGTEILRSREKVELRGKYQQIPSIQQSTETNLGYFRDYCTFLLKNHPMISSQYLLSAYLGAPTKFGIPFYLIVSVRETGYERFLEIQSEILEEIILLAPLFKLRVFQYEERFSQADSL